MLAPLPVRRDYAQFQSTEVLPRKDSWNKTCGINIWMEETLDRGNDKMSFADCETHLVFKQKYYYSN